MPESPPPAGNASPQASIETRSADSVPAVDPAAARAISSLGSTSERFEDRYTPGRMLGAGGMGEVRLFTDKHIEREVAVKMIHPSRGESEGVQRFVREARIQGRLEHPSIVPVYDVSTTASGEPFMTMRRVQGVTLKDLREDLAEGDATLATTWTRRRLLTAFSSVCLAVHYAHTRGVIHRDLKPANIMLGEFGEVYVLDWGVAKLLPSEALRPTLPESPTALERQTLEERTEAAMASLGDADADALTIEGVMLGTPKYMSPEQFDGDSNRIDARADVYALGLILFELLTLRQLHHEREIPEIYRATLLGVDARPTAFDPTVAPELEEICVRATQRDPFKRFASAKELAECVERYLDGDRDLARRRELADEHVARAQSLAERARSRDAVGSEETHKEALREVVQAIALDPSRREARRTLVQLVSETPSRLPSPVEHEWQERLHGERRTAMRSGFLGWLSWCAAVPVAATLGIRSMTLYAVGAALIVLGTVHSAWLTRKSRVTGFDAVVFATLCAVIVASFGAWLGPFVLVPLAATGVMFLISGHATRVERFALCGLMVAAIVLPYVLEKLGVLGSSMAFRDGQLVLLPRAFEIREAPTMIAFLWTGIGFAVGPALLVGRIRDALTAAQRQLLMQSWLLRQFAED